MENEVLVNKFVMYVLAGLVHFLQQSQGVFSGTALQHAFQSFQALWSLEVLEEVEGALTNLLILFLFVFIFMVLLAG